MADVNREVSIAINIIGNAGEKIPAIAALFQSIVDPIKDLRKDIGIVSGGLANLSTNLLQVKNNIPDLSGFSSSLSTLANKTGAEKLTKLSDSLLAFKGIQLPANFDKFVKGIKEAGDAKNPPDLTKFVEAVRAVSGVKGIPVAQLAGLSTSLKGFKGLTGLPQKSLITFAEGLRALRDVKGIRSANLAAIADALKKFSDAKIPTGDKIGKFVDGLKRLTEVKGIRVTNLAAIGQALQSFGSITKIPKLDAFIDSLKRLAKLDFKNIGTATQQIKSFAQSIASLSNSLPAVNNALTKNATAANKTSSSMNKLNTAVKKVDSTYGNFMKKIERYAQYRLIADSIIGLKEAFYTGFQEIVNYDQALKDLQAITSSTAGQVEMMGATIKQVASDTKFSASEVAVGMRTLGQAGFSAQESIGAMESIANLATGTLSSMDQAVDLVSTAIRVYGADTLDAAKASDVFANAVNKSKLTIDKIRTSFNYIGPIAKNAGITFEETASAMAVLANAGLKASKIGTGLRRVIAELVDPNKRLAEAVKLAGLSLDDLNPQKNNLDTVLRNLSIVLTDSSVAFDLFGKRGAAAALTLTQDASAFKDMQKVIGESGTAAEMAEIQMEGLGVSFKNLRDKLSLVMVALGEAGLIEGMKSFVDVMRLAVDAITAFINSGLGKMTVEIGLMSAKILLAVSAFGFLKTALLGLKVSALASFFKPLAISVAGLGTVAKATSVQLGTLKVTSIAAGHGVMSIAKATPAAVAGVHSLNAALLKLTKGNAWLLAITAAIIAFTFVWGKLKKAFISGAGDITKEAFKTSEAVAGLTKSFESYKKDVSGLDESSEKFKSRNKELRAELAKVAEGNDLMSAAALKAMKSINALTGEIIDGGDALDYYAKKAKEVEFEKMIDGVQSLSATFNQNTGMWKGFFGNLTYSGSQMNNLVGAMKKGEISMIDFRTGVEELVDAGDLSDFTKEVVKTLRDIDSSTNTFLQTLANKSLINVDMTVDELLKIPQVMKALAGDTGEVTAILTKNFEEYAQAVKDQQEAIVEKWNKTGTVMESIAKDESGAYAELKKSVDSLTDAEKLRVLGIEETQTSLVSALTAERAEYEKKVRVLEAVRDAAKGGSEEQEQAVRDLAALQGKFEKENTALLKKATELQKKKWGTPEYARLMKEQTAIFKYELAKQEAAAETNLIRKQALYAQASIDFEKAMKRAKIHIVDEDALDKDLDALEAARDIALAENEVYLSKNEHNLAQSISNEFDIQDKFFTDSINAKQAYRDSLFELNENNPEIDKQDKEIRELKQEHYEALLDSAKDYYEELADLKGDFKDVEKNLAKESKLHLKNIQKQLKAEEKFRDKKQDLWDKYKDKRADQLEKLKDLEDSYREDKFQAEKDLRDKILGLEDSLEDKIRKKEQEGMSSKQKARDNEKTYTKKMREANALLAKGIKENDEGIIERAATKFQQSQDLAQSFEKQKKSINGMKKSNEGLIKSEKALADIQGKERDKDYKDDKKEIKTDLATATKEYIKARDDMTASFKRGQDDIKQAIAEELGVRKDLYKTVEGFEDARHSKIAGNLDVEREKIVALIELYSKLARTTEQEAKEAKPGSESTGTSGSSAAVKNLETIDQAAKKSGQTVAKVKAQVEEVTTNATYGLANSVVSGVDAAGKKLVDFVVVTLESGKKVITTAKEMGTAFSSFGKRIGVEPLKAVQKLGAEAKKVAGTPLEMEIEVKTEETMKRTVNFIGVLQGKIKDIGLDYESGIEFIGPEQNAAIDAVAAKISGLFVNLNTDDPKQKLQDMITTLEGVADPKIYDAMKQEIVDYAATIDGVDISLLEDDAGREALTVVDETGKAITGLKNDIQSNPLELFPADFNKPIVDKLNQIEGVFVFLKSQVEKELVMKMNADKAKEEIKSVDTAVDEVTTKLEKDPSRGIAIPTEFDASVKAIAQTISSAFDGFDTTEPQQKIKDMITVAEGMSDPVIFQGMKDEIKKVADATDGVNLAETFTIEEGVRKSVLSLVDDTGTAITGLKEDLQSDPFELFPADFNKPIVENMNEIKGLLDTIRIYTDRKMELKVAGEEAREEISSVDGSYEAFMKKVAEEHLIKIKGKLDKEQLEGEINDISEYGDDGYAITIPMTPEMVEEELGESVDDAYSKVQTIVESKAPVEFSAEIGIDDLQTSISDTVNKVGELEESFTDLDGKQIVSNYTLEADEAKETIADISEFSSEPPSIEAKVVVDDKEALKLKETATVLETIGEADNTEAKVKVEVKGDEKVVTLKEGIDGIVNKLVEVAIHVTGIPQVIRAKEAIDKIPKETHKYVYIHTIDVKGKASGGFIDTVSRFAGGGDVFRRLASPFIGTGSGTKDDVPAMLMKGEFVLKKSAVEKYGKKFLYAMNMGMLNFDSAVSKFAHGGPVQNVANNVSNMMTFPTHFEAGGFVNKAKTAAFMMGRQAQLGLNPKAPFTNDDVVYNINAPSFHQHVDTQVSRIKSTPGKARALNLVKLFSALAPKLQSGGNVSELMAQYQQEKSIITQQYTEDIRYAKESGDDEQAYLLEMEQLQLEELAATLAITLNEIRLDYEQDMIEATTDLEDQVAEFEEDKEDAALDYREAMSDLNSERADIEREYLKEKRELERDLTKAETELEVAQRNFDAGAYVKAGGKDYWQRRGSNRFTYNTVKSPAYNMLQDKVTTAKAEIVDVKQGLVNVESDFEVQKDHTEEDEKNIEFRQTTASDRADRRIVRTQNNFTASASGLENRYEQEAKGEAEHAKNEASMIKLETSHDVSVSKSETSHEVSKLGFELQLELLHLRQTYDELIREEKRRLEDEAKSEYSTSVAPQQNIGIKYWLNKGGYVGFPRGKKRWEDSVSAMLTPGEYVVTEDAVDHYGIDFMEALNNREVDPEYNAFPSFLAEPKIVNTPTTINGVTYHVNAPSFHDNLAARSNKLVTPEGQASAKRMVSMFSDAVPHLATGGDIGNAEEQLAFELTNTQAEYDEKIRYAKAVGADDLAFILENEKIELAMIAEELRFTLMDLKDQRDFAIQEAELDRDQELLDNQMELEEDLFAIQEDRMDARIAMQDAVDDANDARKDAEMDLSYAQTAQSDYDSEYGGAGSRFPTKLNAKQKAALAKLDSFVYGATGKRLYASVASTESQAMTYFTAANQAITSRAPSTTGSSSPFGTGFGGTGSINRSTRSSTAIPVETQMQHRTTISEIKEEFTNAKPSEEDIPDAPPESDIDRPKEEIRRARLQAARARQRYATLMGMYAKQETKERYEKSAQDTIDLKTYDYAVTKADRTFTHGSKKALNVAANDTRKVKNDSAHDYTQREEEMINEIQLLEIELAKALFDLKKEYSTADGDVGVRHWLNTGGSVGYPTGATRGIDSVSAMLTPGEYVVNEGAVRKFGVEFFEKLNKMKLPSLHFAEGGLVPGGDLLSGSTTESLSDTFLGTVNLQVGKKQFPVKTNLNLAKDLVKEFKKMGLSIA